jgi:hypothetical protein
MPNMQFVREAPHSYVPRTPPVLPTATVNATGRPPTRRALFGYDRASQPAVPDPTTRPPGPRPVTEPVRLRDPEWRDGRHVFLGPDGGHYRRSNYGRRVFRPACDGRFEPALSRPARLVIAGATVWPGVPVARWRKVSRDSRDLEPDRGARTAGRRQPSLPNI